MLQRREWASRGLGVAVGAAAWLVSAAPVLAQEGGGGGGGAGSYAARFLHTDNALGTALIWFCLLISIAIVSMIIQNALRNRRSAYTPPALAEDLERLIAEKKFREAIELASGDPSP